MEKVKAGVEEAPGYLEYDVYLSGPMTGYDHLNEPEFVRVAGQIRDSGLTVYSPIEHPIIAAHTTNNPDGYRYYLPPDVQAVCKSRAIALLKGWSASKGAQIELAVARAIGMPVLDAYTLEPLTIDQEAHAYVHGARRNTYGHPLDDYGRTAALVSIRLADYLKRPLDAEACVAFMQMVKISRLTQSPDHLDSQVDLIGYTLCDALIREERKRREAAQESFTHRNWRAECTQLT